MPQFISRKSLAVFILLTILKIYTTAFKVSLLEEYPQPFITNNILTKYQTLKTNKLPKTTSKLLISTDSQPSSTDGLQLTSGNNLLKYTTSQRISTNNPIKRTNGLQISTITQPITIKRKINKEKRSIGKFNMKILSNLDKGKDDKFDKLENKTVGGSTNEAVNFMKKFGYVPAGDDKAGFIFSAATFTEKLKQVQKFGAIPQTGELDPATIELMSSPRCGVHDMEPEEGKRRRKRFILGSKGWNKRHLTYTLGNWSPQLMSKENTQAELKRAFDHWSRYSNLKFTEIDSNEADIVIFFASYSHYDNYPFDGQGGILAHAYYPYEFGSYGGDIHFDESEEWRIKPEKEHSGLDFFTVAVHEIGHSLGLAHSHVPTSIMFPYYKGIEESFALDYDDIMGMWELYIRRKLDGDDEYFKTTRTTEESTTTTTTSTYDETQNDEGDETVRYHGDAETVDEHEERNKGSETDEESLPSLPPMFPDNEDDYYERERKWREEENRRRKVEEERRKRIEEEERKRWEEDKRREREEEEERYREEERKRREEDKRRREEDNKRRREWENRRTTEMPPVTSGAIPDICNGDFDSVALLRDELFVFKGEYMWRFEKQGTLLQGYPAHIRNLFDGLPNLTRIDAAYERRNDSNIVFFIGNQFFVHDGQKVVEDTSKSLTAYGLPEEISRIDAVFFWPKNRKTYIFSRNVYWRRDDFTDTLDENYPRGIEKWNGVPKDLDAAVTDIYGISYFFKKNQVWQYNNDYVRPTQNSPSSDLRRWTGC